jgi:hypothetical protein
VVVGVGVDEHSTELGEAEGRMAAGLVAQKDLLRKPTAHI